MRAGPGAHPTRNRPESRILVGSNLRRSGGPPSGPPPGGAPAAVRRPPRATRSPDGVGPARRGPPAEAPSDLLKPPGPPGGCEGRPSERRPRGRQATAPRDGVGRTPTTLGDPPSGRTTVRGRRRSWHRTTSDVSRSPLARSADVHLGARRRATCPARPASRGGPWVARRSPL